MLIKLSDEDIERCEEFAEKCVHTNNYASRGQKNIKKRTLDIINGKMAELAVWQFFASNDYSINNVDFNIYDKKNKSHGEDLIVEGIPLEVKSQTLDSSVAYGMSWLFEKSASEKLKGHLMAFCTVLPEGIVLINNIVPFEDCPLSLPVLPQLRTKKAIYYDEVLLNKFIEYKEGK